MNDDSCAAHTDRDEDCEKSLRLVISNADPQVRAASPIEPAHAGIELTFDEGILVTCSRCSISWRVEECRPGAQWWLCPARAN